MRVDPRLADPLLLVLAARRAKQRQVTVPRQRVVLKVVYADEPGEPPMVGPEYVYYLPETGPAWRADPC